MISSIYCSRLWPNVVRIPTCLLLLVHIYSIQCHTLACNYTNLSSCTKYIFVMPTVHCVHVYVWALACILTRLPPWWNLGNDCVLCVYLHPPYSCRQTVIHYCAAQNFVEFLHDLADLGAAVDLADTRGLTPLHLAAGSGRTSAVSALVGRGADANVAAPNGDTPLHLACQYGHTTVVSAYIYICFNIQYTVLAHIIYTFKIWVIS